MRSYWQHLKELWTSTHEQFPFLYHLRECVDNGLVLLVIILSPILAPIGAWRFYRYERAEIRKVRDDFRNEMRRYNDLHKK